MSDFYAAGRERLQQYEDERYAYQELVNKSLDLEELRLLRLQATRVDYQRVLSKRYPKFSVLRICELAQATYEAATKRIKELEATVEV